MATSTMVSTSLCQLVSVKRDASHLGTLENQSGTIQQVMSPSLETNQIVRPKQQRSMTPRTSRAVRRGREHEVHDEDASVAMIVVRRRSRNDFC
eukprot:353290-Amphidinium_carterae.1